MPQLLRSTVQLVYLVVPHLQVGGGLRLKLLYPLTCEFRLRELVHRGGGEATHQGSPRAAQGARARCTRSHRGVALEELAATTGGHEAGGGGRVLEEHQHNTNLYILHCYGY